MESLIPVKKDIKCELEYQEEPMDVNETLIDGCGEEGEINSSDDEESTCKQCPSNEMNAFTSNYHKSQTGELFSSSKAVSKDEAQKKLNRAKRFSLSKHTIDAGEIHKVKLSNLCRDLGIDKENERHYRFNAIHMRGTENMSTHDVLQYFVSFAPSHVEWINDVSCNVIWMDDVSTASALLNISKKIKNLDKVHLNADPFEKDYKNYSYKKEVNDDDDDDDDDDDAVDAREIATAIPPGIWRIGVPCKKSSCLLLRYATRSDKKQRNAERNSEYYKKYGNPHYGNIPGLISSSLRSGVRKSRFKASHSTNSVSNQGEKRNPWEELAYEWGKRDEEERKDEKCIKSSFQGSQISDLRISLTNKKERGKRLRTDSDTSINYACNETWESRSKIPRMKMYADDEEKRLEKTSEKRLLTNKFKSQPEKDLRSKINKKKGRPRFKFTSEKKPVSESSNTENEYDDLDSGEWALEHYHDLRESLLQNKRHERHSYVKRRYDSSGESSDNMSDKFYERDFNCRSPLQIEIENDEYYHNKM